MASWVDWSLGVGVQEKKAILGNSALHGWQQSPLRARADLQHQYGTTEFNAQTIDQVLSAAGQFAAEVIAPMNASGDREGCRVPQPGVVLTPQGFRSAYLQFTESGWTSLGCSTESGGQDL